eukprot:GHVP01000738.1.p1 GENE.GHVP01000738.1~~GHVP01000738.1.p1  ORF type:complete len:702 (-),score=90.29 GHVP01000738.1:1208-3313(-)
MNQKAKNSFWCFTCGKEKRPAKESLFYTMETTIYLRVYDISKGKAATWSPILLGKRIPGIWHTGVLAFDNEYFYATGIEKMTPEEIEETFRMKPVATHFLGRTTKTKKQFSLFLLDIFQQFTPDTYDLLKWNCNHFTDICSKFLCGCGIPAYITDLPDTFNDTPLGRGYVNMAKYIRGDNPITKPEDPNHPCHSLPYNIRTKKILLDDAESDSIEELEKPSVQPGTPTSSSGTTRSRENQCRHRNHPHQVGERRHRTSKQSPLLEGYLGINEVKEEKGNRSRSQMRSAKNEKSKESSQCDSDKKAKSDKKENPRSKRRNSATLSNEVLLSQSELNGDNNKTDTKVTSSSGGRASSPPRKLLPRARPDTKTVPNISINLSDVTDIPRFQLDDGLQNRLLPDIHTVSTTSPRAPRMRPDIHTVSTISPQAPRVRPDIYTISRNGPDLHPVSPRFGLDLHPMSPRFGQDLHPTSTPSQAPTLSKPPFFPSPVTSPQSTGSSNQQTQNQNHPQVYVPPLNIISREPKSHASKKMPVPQSPNGTFTYKKSPSISWQAYLDGINKDNKGTPLPFVQQHQPHFFAIGTKHDTRGPAQKRVPPSEASTAPSEKGYPHHYIFSPTYSGNQKPPHSYPFTTKFPSTISKQEYPDAPLSKMRALSPLRRCGRCGVGMPDNIQRCSVCGGPEAQHRPPKQLRYLPSVFPVVLK